MSGQKMSHLALQGGGAHGAFGWGVLDKILEDGRIKVDSICATSAGSMNAIVYAQGKMLNGNDGAREALHDFWHKVSQAGRIFGGKVNTPIDKMYKKITYNIFDTMSHVVSPYQFNPLNFNFLKDILEKTVDFEKLRSQACTKLYISATNVRSGQVRIFDNAELSLEVILASSCLPYLFHAVKIDEDYYWDGGYMGNPALFPLFYHKGEIRDIIIVHINPIVRDKLPTTASEIMNRINEITFNSSLISEFRAISFATKLIEEGWLKEEYQKNLKHVLVHSIRADQALLHQDISTKFDTDWQFLTYLRDLGRLEAENWIEENFHKIGKESSIDIKKEFLNPEGKKVQPFK